jgi:hypothetical protein
MIGAESGARRIADCAKALWKDLEQTRLFWK